jgi:ATP-dependent DNA ligase
VPPQRLRLRRSVPRPSKAAADAQKIIENEIRVKTWEDCELNIRRIEQLNTESRGVWFADESHWMIAKRRDRPYRSGRSPDWVKVKYPDAPAATRVIDR